MGVPPYTRIDIITEGLTQVGRVDLTSNARKWLNLFLDKVYRNYDWPFLVRDSGYLGTVQGTAFPSLYRAMKTSPTIYVLSNGAYVAQREATTADMDEYRALLRQGNVANAQPRRVVIDQDLRQFKFWPAPDQVYYFQFDYYYAPTLPTDADASGDTSVPLWPLPQETLIKAISLKAKYYDDHESYSQEEQALLKEIEQTKFNAFDRRGGSNKIKLGKSFRRRF